MRTFIALLIAASVLLTGCIQLPIFSFGTEEKGKVKVDKVKADKEKRSDDTEGDLNAAEPTAKPKQKSPGNKGK